MADDLVKRLRCYADLNDAVFHPWVYGEAADRIEKLKSALRILANITDCDTEGKLPVDTKLTWARQKLFDVRQLARKALDAE